MATPSYYQQTGSQYSLIPGAGTYLQDQAKAQSAYERSKAQLMAQRAQKQIGAGLNEKYDVDPNSQYGTYQTMLQTQGGQLQQMNEQAMDRGFFGPGLGNQGESMLRYGQAVENLGFKNSLTDFENQYQAQMGDIERQNQESQLGAMQGAAYDNGYPDMSGGGSPDDNAWWANYYASQGQAPMIAAPAQSAAIPAAVKPFLAASKPVVGSIQAQAPKQVITTLAKRLLAGRM